MIYLFGKGKSVSIIYAPETLTEKDKQGAVIVEALPPKEVPEGHYEILCLDDNNVPYWEYKIIEQPSEDIVV
jgi:hypothetical protein